MPQIIAFASGGQNISQQSDIPLKVATRSGESSHPPVLNEPSWRNVARGG
jgi:hypothetical protein